MISNRHADSNKGDALLVKMCLEGDKEQYEILIERYKPMIYNLCYRMTGDMRDAEDLAQDTFVSAYRNLGRYDTDRKFSTWLYTIALNLCRDRLKRKKPVSRSLDAPAINHEDLYPQIPSGELTPEETSAAIEEEELVRKGIMKLPPKYRQVIILRHQLFLSYEEISLAINSPVKTVKVWLHRARNKLKRIFEEEGLR
ncbi:MAG: sigma-70 family RNA polymerase sigma factor [Elusimicrobia bacterium]|nr:sigma-70 family RNA polymerase sigma factor [Elusimicrobiota bacterium]